ncbi:hypothetical protein Anas_03504 [Armadillidium nasatum]|uniref:Uncharacterized protein n=1 Tax=Armadillidium nasatum TaxID=96803 RepID=A0A5N5TFZ6_9CRUS|nr:hypothetical protein Anas_03504 [Armadillidium nasatum]
MNMDIKNEIEITEELVENLDVKNNHCNFEQDSYLEVQKKCLLSNIDIKEEIEIKEEEVSLEIGDKQIDVKEEDLEINEEELDIVEDHLQNGHHSNQISALDESQGIDFFDEESELQILYKSLIAIGE